MLNVNKPVKMMTQEERAEPIVPRQPKPERPKRYLEERPAPDVGKVVSSVRREVRALGEELARLRTGLAPDPRIDAIHKSIGSLNESLEGVAKAQQAHAAELARVADRKISLTVERDRNGFLKGINED